MKQALSPHSSLLAPHAVEGTVLAFDFGVKRIGVAVGDLSLRIAHPLITLEAAQNVQRFNAIAALIKEWQPVLLVVGLPAHMDGSEHEISKLCRRFALRLEQRFKLHTILADERLSSHAAELSLADSGAARDKTLIDQVAAQHILQSYFDELETS
ncbi:MAG TPA: Holliday junction resolvase RuvX [Burkholderiales bacterium]|nr:Holliday junction resolvase RuvX [Burkholderiales bacterium]